MEVYIPYVIGSTLTAFLGNIAYNYYTYDDVDDTKDIVTGDYDLMFETNFILVKHKPSNKFFKNRIFFPLPASNFVINFINAINIYISRLIFFDESFC